MAARDRGFTLIELLIVVAIISIIAAIAVPGLMRARMTGNEASAITSLTTTRAAQVMYSASCGAGGFAATYQILGTPPGGNPNGEAFISRDLGHAAPIQKAGYNFNMSASAGAQPGQNDCNGTPTISAWYATAVPMTVGTTGQRGFAINTSNTIWQDTTGQAPTEPFTPSATVTVAQ